MSQLREKHRTLLWNRREQLLAFSYRHVFMNLPHATGAKRKREVINAVVDRNFKELDEIDDRIAEINSGRKPSARDMAVAIAGLERDIQLRRRAGTRSKRPKASDFF
jgi:hypothetical protein